MIRTIVCLPCEPIFVRFLTSTLSPFPFFFGWESPSMKNGHEIKEEKSVDDLAFLLLLEILFSSPNFHYENERKIVSATFNRCFFSTRHSRMLWWKSIHFTRIVCIVMDCHLRAFSRNNSDEGREMTLICCLLLDHWLDILLCFRFATGISDDDCEKPKKAFSPSISPDNEINENPILILHRSWKNLFCVPTPLNGETSDEVY